MPQYSSHNIGQMKKQKLVEPVLQIGDKQDQFIGLNIERPKYLTPELVELHIQAERAIYALNRMLSMIRLMAHLPEFLNNNAEVLKKHLKREEVAYILKHLKLYGLIYVDDEPSHIRDNVAELGNIVSKIQINLDPNKGYEQTTSVDNWMPFVTIPAFELNPHVSQIVDIMCYNKCLKYHACTQRHVTTIQNMVEFAKCLEGLKKIALRKLYMTGNEEEARERELRRAYKSNIILTTSLEYMKGQLEVRRKELREEVTKKTSKSDYYYNKVATIKENFQIVLGKTLHDSEKLMMRQCIESEEKIANLTEAAKQLTAEYETLLEDDLSSEKAMRAKRMKTKVQLQSWFAKYDQDIGEKQAEYEALDKQYEAEKDALFELEDKFEEQQQVYEVLMAEKEEEEDRITNEMAFQYLMNRSARRIQRYWRAYRERRKRKRGKGKKGKGKGKPGKPKKK